MKNYVLIAILLMIACVAKLCGQNLNVKWVQHVPERTGAFTALERNYDGSTGDEKSCVGKMTNNDIVTLDHGNHSSILVGAESYLFAGVYGWLCTTSSTTNNVNIRSEQDINWEVNIPCTNLEKTLYTTGGDTIFIAIRDGMEKVYWVKPTMSNAILVMQDDNNVIDNLEAISYTNGKITLFGQCNSGQNTCSINKILGQTNVGGGSNSTSGNMLHSITDGNNFVFTKKHLNEITFSRFDCINYDFKSYPAYLNGNKTKIASYNYGRYAIQVDDYLNVVGASMNTEKQKAISGLQDLTTMGQFIVAVTGNKVVVYNDQLFEQLSKTFGSGVNLKGISRTVDNDLLVYGDSLNHPYVIYLKATELDIVAVDKEKTVKSKIYLDENSLNIEFESKKIGHIELYDHIGRRIFSEDYDSNHCIIDRQKLAKGLLIVKTELGAKKIFIE